MHSSLHRNNVRKKNYTNEKTLVAIFIFIFSFSQLIVFGQNNNPPNENIHLAALQGNTEVIKKLIEAGTDLNKKDQYGSTPLIIAVLFGKNEAAKELINAGADLNITNNEESTPLHIAALMGRIEIVKLLLKKGADKYLRNINGSTAFDLAAAPFEYDKKIYDQLSMSLGPIGLKLDYEKIKELRPKIAEMLRASKVELASIDYKPIERNDWNLSTPKEQNLDEDLVAELYNDASHLETIYSLLVIKNGYLVGEKYYKKGSIDQLSKRASVTKSYVSALMGIALNKGCIKSVDEKMIDYFPEVAGKIKDQRKKEITIKEMLQMRAGFPWEETDTTYWNALWSGRYLNKIVDIPLTKDPGSEFQYSNLTSNWLGIIISRACKTDLKSFGEKYLFNLLNVKLGNWLRDWDGYYIGSGDIEFTARDMAKFGLLYLNNGKYNKEQLIPSDWVKQSLQSYSKNINSAGISNGRVGRYFHDIGYGYQWWNASVGKHKFNLAWGHGGQFIILLRDLNMVIVVTSDPFWGKEKHFKAWKHEQAASNLVGKFIKNLTSVSNKND